MEFNSYLFILAMLPITVIVFRLLQKCNNRYLSIAFLVIASLFFVGNRDLYSLAFLLASIVVNYAIAGFLKHPKYGKLILAFGIAVNVGTLAVVRYFVDRMFIGISFVTFQQIIFLVDSYKGLIDDKSVANYIFYITYFPKYVQGPIVKYDTVVSCLNKEEREKSAADEISCGLYYFAIGLAKKVLLADVLAKGVSYGWNNLENLSSAEAVITILLFTLQIYFDFSGYSHMAIGVSKMIGIDLPDNFDNPYIAKDISDFWGRWHISLTNFLREYIYIPLGGNRKGLIRTLINILIVYIISGAWHGAAITFVIWGLLHGVASCIHRVIKPIWKKVPGIIQWACTFGFVNFAWIFFRAPSVEAAFMMIKKVFAFEQFYTSEALKTCFHTAEISFLAGRFAGFNDWLSVNSGKPMYAFVLVAILLMFLAKDKMEKFRPTIWRSILAGSCLFFSIISLSTVVGFIYENF